MAELKDFPVNESLDVIFRRLEQLERGNGSDKMTDARVSKLETIADFMREDISEIKKDIREFRSDMKHDNKETRRAVIITGISVILGVGGIIGGMVYSIAQIQTSWITSIAQILNR